MTTTSRRARALVTAAAVVRHLGPALARRTPPATALRRLFAELGSTYVKLGQIMASAPTIFGDELSEEFRSLLDTGPSVPFPLVRDRIEAELGRPLDACFADFEGRPLAAASLAVVHRARLHDGRAVAVKVLRPGIEDTVRADLDLMEPVLRFLALQGFSFPAGLYQVVSGLRPQLAAEVDLRQEAAAMDRFRGLFAAVGLDRLVVPGVVADLTSEHVLTMDLLDGVPIDDLDTVERLGIDPRPLARDLLRSWLATALRFGEAHGDLHAGNLLLLGDGRIGVLDWGIVAYLDGSTRLLIRRLIEAALGDETAWLDIHRNIFRMTGILSETYGLNEDEMVRAFRLNAEPMLTSPLRDVSLSVLMRSSEETLRTEAGGGPAAVRQRLQSWRKDRRFNRLAMEQGLFTSDFQRSNTNAIKQLMYFERYGRMYIPDEALLGDREFLERLIRSV